MSRILLPNQAFTSNSLNLIQRALLRPQAISPNAPAVICEQTPTPWAPADLYPPKAAILIPLMNIRGIPNLLVQVRSQALRVHAGEIRCVTGRGAGKTLTCLC
jgi:hypothetical protein